MKNDFQFFLNVLAEALEFSNLKPDIYGCCLLDFNKEHSQILFEYDEGLVPNSILLSSEITTIPHEVYIDVVQECLIENFNIAETLSCRPNENILFLHRRIHTQIEAPDLKIVLDSFLDQIENWRKKVNQLSQIPAKTLRIPVPAPHLQIYPFKG